MGMTHKLHAYASALNLPYSQSMLLLEFAACALGTIEFVLGVYLLLGVHRRWTARITTVFMLVFTALTTWIYIDNPVPDCGCFGDAIILTNAQTLLKNIVLLAASVFCYTSLHAFIDLFRHAILGLSLSILGSMLLC